ncbi:MAG TPA: FtsX-like permease family protein [Casimicrobiaceae bacterium]
MSTRARARSDLALALRLLRGDWRRGELVVLVGALVLAVASVATVGLFTDRIARGLATQADRLLGADLMVSGDAPLPATFASEARSLGLATTPVVRFNSMIQREGGGAAVLTDVKAVTRGYPLRGAIARITSGKAVTGTSATPAHPGAGGNGGETIAPPETIPAPGEAWIDRHLAERLDAHRGTILAVGDTALRVTAIFTREPEVAGLVFAPAPKLLFNAADLDATHLLQPGTRASFRLMVAARDDPGALERYRTWLARTISAGQRVDTVGDLRPELRQTLDRAARFLGLAALASVLLAAAAVALASARYLRRHLDVAAMLRCFGAPAARTLRLFLVQFAITGAAAGLVGVIVGAGAQEVMVALLAGADGASLPWPSWWPALEAVAIAIVLLLGFALPPLVTLAHEPPLRVLRRDVTIAGARRLATWAAAIVAIAALIAWEARAVEAAWLIVAGVAALLVVAAIAGRLLLIGVARLPARGASWRFGLANLRRRALASSLQIGALALGGMALLLLAVVRGDLLADWRAALPPDAPNRFLVNVLPDQRDAVRELVTHSIGVRPDFEPMVRGRLVEKNGAALDAVRSDDPRTRRLAQREFNLSWTDRLPPGNDVVAGRFWSPDARGAAAGISFEQGIAERLGVRLGDRLTFDAGGVRVTAPVTSLRKVQWDSFRVNFFALFAPGALDGLPDTWISAFRVPNGAGEAWSASLVQRYPNVLVIDVTEILGEVEGVIDRVARAVEFVFLFTLAAGILVLEAAVVATQDERRMDAAVLRTLGASTRQLRSAVVAEFALVGALAGALAAAGATVLGRVLASRVFDTPYHGSALLWLYAVAGGAALVTGAGWLGTRSTLTVPPLAVLRELG